MRVIRSEKCDGRDMCHVCETREVHRSLWWGDLRERDTLKDLGIDGRTIIKLIFRKCDGETWAGLIWLRKRTGGGCL